MTLLIRRPTFGKRHIQAIVLAAVLFFGYVTRSVLSVAIIAMTDPTASANKNVPTFNWTNKGVILSFFLWGYIIPQVGAGYLADHYGAKWFLTGTIFITAIVGMLIPTAAVRIGSRGVMACNIIQGLCQGFLYPSLNGLLGKWIPSDERTRLGAFVYSGGPLGLLASMQITGFISASWYGWPLTFYLINSLLLVLCGIYAYFGSSDPYSHPTISKEERTYIINNLKIRDGRKLLTPWKKILTNIPFWALVITSMGFTWMHWAHITQTSLYIKNVMNFKIESNGVISSLPYLAEYFAVIIAALSADFFVKKKIFSTTTIRKAANTAGLLIPSMCLYFLGNCRPKDEKLAIALIIIIGGTHGFGKAGFLVNHMDLSPNFSGILMGFCNGLSNVVSALAPLLLNIVIKDEKDVSQWKTVFYISMGITMTSAATNIFFTSGEMQPWNKGKSVNSGT